MRSEELKQAWLFARYFSRFSFFQSLTCFALGKAQASLALLSLFQQVHHTDEQGDDSRHGGADGTDVGNGLLGGGGLRGNDDLTTGLYLGATLGLGDRTILIEDIGAGLLGPVAIASEYWDTSHYH